MKASITRIRDYIYKPHHGPEDVNLMRRGIRPFVRLNYHYYGWVSIFNQRALPLECAICVCLANFEFRFLSSIMADNISVNRRIYILWQDIPDILGNASGWPYYIRRLFWTKSPRHFDRILICTFCFMNGLNPHILYEWAEMTDMCRDAAAMGHLRNVFRALEDGQTLSNSRGVYRLYSWNIINARYEYLDGTVRYYLHRDIPDRPRPVEGKKLSLIL